MRSVRLRSSGEREVGVSVARSRALTALLVGLQLVRAELMRAEAVWLDAAENDFLSGVMVYDSAFTDDSTGEHVSFDEAYARFPEEFGPQGSGMPPG